MKKSAPYVAALALSIGSAFADDLPDYKSPPPPLLWNGFYFGLNAGYTWSSSNAVSTSSVTSFDAIPGGYGTTSALLGTFRAPISANGFIGGGQIGYNFRFADSFVAGVEADFQGMAGGNSSTRVSSALGNDVLSGTGLQVATVNKSLDYLSTVRGRLGWLLTPTLLVYGTGGLAYGGAKAYTSIFQTFVPPAGAAPDISGAGAFGDTRVGWTAGGGAEWAFWRNCSAKVEYLYYDLGSVTYGLTPLFNALAVVNYVSVSQSTARFNGHIVRAGVNYHFSWDAAPVVAQ